MSNKISEIKESTSQSKQPAEIKIIPPEDINNLTLSLKACPENIRAQLLDFAQQIIKKYRVNGKNGSLEIQRSMILLSNALGKNDNDKNNLPEEDSINHMLETIKLAYKIATPFQKELLRQDEVAKIRKEIEIVQADYGPTKSKVIDQILTLLRADNSNEKQSLKQPVINMEVDRVMTIY
jgi:hypothetical protein